MESVLFLPVEDLSKKLAANAISAESLTRGYLERIGRLDPILNAYTEVYAEAAIMQAIHSDQRRAQGQCLGPLDGIPIAVKDLCDIAGRPTSMGSKAWATRTRTQTATAIDRLIRAGAVILGKTQMEEFAFGSWGVNPFLGTPRNPWDMAVHRIPGGSSSGSALAVAAGMAAAAIGSDTGGSVRIPAAMNGITGLKTTAGLISLNGVAPLSETLDTLGPLTRSAWDADLIARLMAGLEPAGPPSRGRRSLGGTVIALVPPDSYPVEVAPAIAQAMDQMVETLKQLGATVIERPFPFDYQEMIFLDGHIAAAEGYAVHQHYIDDANLEIGPVVRERIQAGKAVTSADYINAMRAHRCAISKWTDWMAGTDALLTPTTHITAFPLSEFDHIRTSQVMFTRIGNFLGSCALVLPAGFDENRLPVGLQLLGKPFDEATLVKIGIAFQRASDWHLRHPDL